MVLCVLVTRNACQASLRRFEGLRIYIFKFRVAVIRLLQLQKHSISQICLNKINFNDTIVVGNF